MDIVSESYRALYPRPWPSWALTQANSQSLSDYISYPTLIELLHRANDVQSRLNKIIAGKTVVQGYDRKLKLSSLRNKIEISRNILIVAAILFIGFLALDYSIPKTDLQLWSVGALLTTAVCGFPTGIWLRDLKRTIARKIELNSSTLFSNPNSTSSRAIIKTNRTLQESGLAPFVREADGIIKSFNCEFWKADGFELGLIESHASREAVSLEGDPPSGPVDFLKQDIERVFGKNIFEDKPVNKKPVKPLFAKKKPSVSKPTSAQRANIESTKKKPYATPKLLNKLRKHSRLSPDLKALQRNKELTRKLLYKADKLKRASQLSKPRTRWVDATRVTYQDWSTWCLYRDGKLTGPIKSNIEKKLMEALTDPAKSSDQNANILYEFQKPDMRNFSAWVHELDIVPPDKIDAIIQIYLNNKK